MASQNNRYGLTSGRENDYIQVDAEDFNEAVKAAKIIQPADSYKVIFFQEKSAPETGLYFGLSLNPNPKLITNPSQVGTSSYQEYAVDVHIYAKNEHDMVEKSKHLLGTDQPPTMLYVFEIKNDPVHWYVFKGSKNDQNVPVEIKVYADNLEEARLKCENLIKTENLEFIRDF